VELVMVRISKIKVRRYGSAYRVDPHNDYLERWDKLRLNKRLSDLWKPSALEQGWVGMRLFIFIGFAQEAEPFHKELWQLDEQLHWEEHGALYQTHCWEDRYERHFNIRLSAWSRSADLQFQS
jgi:hypothetical protein